MARTRSLLTQADYTRMIKGAAAAGVPVFITVNPREGIFKIEPIIEREKTSEQVSDHKHPIVL